MRNIFIYGCGGFGKEVLQIIRDLKSNNEEISCKGFIVSPEHRKSDSVQGMPVYDSFENFSNGDELIIAIGSSSDRIKVLKKIIAERPDIVFSTLIHPAAWIGHNVNIGSGAVICAGALITTDIVIGNHVHINIGCTIGHDSEVKDFATLNPSVNVSGNVTIGEGCEIGTGSILIPKIEVGDWSITGAGCVVTHDLPGNITAVGVPAKIIKQNESGWQFA
jgi:sugar O-acyltransferase (sialic acid O-acetyltransferase NeuD family)